MADERKIADRLAFLPISSFQPLSAKTSKDMAETRKRSCNPDSSMILTTVFTGVRTRDGLRKRRICGIVETNPSPTSLGSSLSPFVRCGSPGKEGLSRTPPCFCSISKAIYIPPLRGSILRERNFARNTVETELAGGGPADRDR